MKRILALGLLLGSFSAFGAQKGKYLVVSGADALQDQQINQYDDVDNPAQGYLLTLPPGYRVASVDVESGGSSICGVSAFDYKTQTLKIDGFSLETDEVGCTVILS